MNTTVTWCGRRSIGLGRLLGTASLAAIAGALSAQAQPMMAAAGPDIPEQVLITGSLIRGEVAVGVPVTQLGAIDFQQTGALTVSDLLKSIPAIQVEASSSIANAGGQINRAAGVDIHGLNSNTSPRTLMMIDGLRFPAQGHGTDRYDPSIIPQLAVDHVDVLADGASATYGSDAIAGVLNVVMKRRFDGAISQLRYGTAQDGAERYHAAQLWGRTWTGGDITLSYEWYDESEISGKDRPDQFTFNYTPWGLDDRTPITSVIPGVVSTGNPATSAGPAVAAGTPGVCVNCFSIPRGIGWNYGNTPAHTNPTAPGSAPTITWAQLQANPGALQNEVNPYYFSSATAAQQRNAATITLDQRLLANVELFVDGFYSNRRTQQRYPVLVNPARNQQNFRALIPTTNPYYPAGAPSGLRINYNISAELQPITAGSEISARWAAGFNIDLPGDWQGRLSYATNFEQNHAFVNNIVNLNAVSAALGNTLAAVPAQGTRPGIAAYTKPVTVPYLNPFCDPFAFRCNSPVTLDYISSIRYYDERYHVNEWYGNFDGPLFDLPGGTVRAAVGAEYDSHNYNFVQTANFNQPGSVTDIQLDPETRQVWAAFTQLNIPIIGENNALPFVRSLVLEGSFRYDHYSDFGGTRNPKVSVNWVPLEGLTIRSAWGTSFRAPAFSDASSVAGAQIQGLNAAAGDTDNTPTCAVGQILPVPGSAADVLAHAISPANPSCAAIPRFPGGLAVRGGGGLASILRGNQKLGPEKATNFSAGFEYTPTTFLSGLSVNATYFHVKVSGLMQGLEATTGAGLSDPATRFTYVLPDDPNFGAYVDFLITNSKSFVNPTLRNSILFISDAAIRNTGSLMVDGLDFGASYDWDLGNWGIWNAGLDGTYFLHRRLISIPGTTPVESYSGNGIACVFCNPNTPDRFRYRAQLGWMDGPYQATVFMNYQSHFYSNQAFPPASVLVNFPNYSDLQPPYYTFDLSLGYNTGNDPANDYLKNLDFRFIVTNLFDKMPPFMYKISSGGSNPAAFDINLSPVGRVMTFVVTKTW